MRKATALLAGLLLVCRSTEGLTRKPPIATTIHNIHPSVVLLKGGGQGSQHEDHEDVTLERYVAEMEQHDKAADNRTTDNDTEHEDENGNANEMEKDDMEQSDHSDASSSSSSPQSSGNGNESDSASVGIKSHSSHSKKKFNAVGDPDGNSSDDSDESDSDSSEWEEFLEEIKETETDNEEPTTAEKSAVEGVHVEYEVVEGMDTLAPVSPSSSSSNSGSGGGGGVRLSNRISRRGSSTTTTTSNTKQSPQSKSNNTKDQQQKCKPTATLLQAWSPHVYLPPSPQQQKAIETNARSIDASSKTRLDRRTLYDELLLEWNNQSPSSRKFLHASTSQALQAALSLATQPKWRKSYPQASVIALNDERSTLAMQETVAMALAHSLGCGMVVLDDDVVKNVQESLQQQQNEENEIENASTKPASLLKSLLAMANDGKFGEQQLTPAKSPFSLSGSIATIMRNELVVGLDDPFDDRAVTSYQNMVEWEANNTAAATDEEQSDNDDNGQNESEETTTDTDTNKPLPLVLFIRTESSTSLLKSKSIVEHLLRECTSSDSIHLIVLGKGIDIHTENLPLNEMADINENGGPSSVDNNGGGSPFHDMGASLPSQQNPQQQQYPNAYQHQQQPPPGTTGPWFGFAPQNQNASGQNDPEGSRRFNIFLARTTDKSGTPGILGAIAPPQAGNLFPQMMALQAKERMQSGAEQQQQQPGMANEEMERWSQMLQQQMEQQAQQQEEENGGDAASSDSNNNIAQPQFFNATLVSPSGSNLFGGPPNGNNPQQQQQQQPPPEVVQQALQQAMTELLDELSKIADDGDGNDTYDNTNANQKELHPDLHKAFAQVLRNENLRRGISENLSRAAPALTDPKCQGVMLSVYVPPPPHHFNGGKLPREQLQSPPAPQQQNTNKSPGWFNKILNKDDTNSNGDDADSSTTNEEDNVSSSYKEKRDNDTSNGNKSRVSKASRKHKDRGRTLAAASAVVAANNNNTSENNSDSTSSDQTNKSNNKSKDMNKVVRNLQKLETLCRHIPVTTPVDPVRRKSWESWITRERGAVLFRQNRRALNSELLHRRLMLQQHNTGTMGVGSSLRQMLSVRDVSDEMEDVIKCAVELEAATSQLQQKTSLEKSESKDEQSRIDISLYQLLVGDDDVCVSIVEDADSDSVSVTLPKEIQEPKKSKMQLLHPSSLEKALAMACRLSPSPSGGLSTSSSSPVSLRSREDIAALAQDKHERALVSQVVSPQDIGVTYDMIGGLTEVKELLRQSVTYPLKFPHLYSEGIAREAVKGVLLFGPPGTGKTMLAKAVATEGGASFLSVDASSVENKWLGESEKNAKAVFTLARRLAPCVIFVDEVDSLLSSREGSSDDSAHGTLTSVKTTMMSEWDGLNSGTNGNGESGSNRVVVIGSTNRPFDLDEAVLRRFPRRILVDLPDLDTRREILEVTLAENRVDPAVNFTKIAERLDGYTGSDIKEVCREAVVQISHELAQIADQGGSGSQSSGGGEATQRLRPVTMDDFEKALGKLKRSVSERGRELARVWEWNDEYGEVKREKSDHLPQLMNMFL